MNAELDLGLKGRGAMVAALMAALVWPASGRAMCGEDVEMRGKAAISAARAAALMADPTPPAAATLSPSAQLAAMTREALRRSAQVGATKLLAEAAADDVREARGGELPRATINGTLGPSQQTLQYEPTNTKFQVSAGLSVTGVLYDAGRTRQLTQWRSELAKAAGYSLQAAQEQVVLETIANALERSRYRQQAQVYQQYARKMACLVEALGQIVSEDRGRASELVQARKTQAQAELQRDQSLALGRTAEIRLRRLVGDQVDLGEGMGPLLGETPDPGEVIRLLSQAGELQQLRAQADAADRLAQATDAGRKPQVGWITSANGTRRGDVNTSQIQAGLTFAYTAFDGSSGEAAAASAARRALATRQLYEELSSQKTSRVRETHDAAISAFDRARRYVDVLKDSDKVRSATFQQWSQLGRRSLFDVMSAESEHFNLRLSYVNALHDGYQANAQLRSMGGGLLGWIKPQ